MERLVVGSITFGSDKPLIPFRPSPTSVYRELVGQLVEQAKKSGISLEDALDDIMKKWKGWDG